MISWFQKSNTTSPSHNRWIPLLVIAALGVLLIVFGASGTKKAEPATEITTTDEELQLYQSQLEDRIKQLCKSVDGVGDITVVVTLEGGFTSVYATEYQNGNESYVIVGSGSNAKPLFLSREAPEIAGIGIVCKGGADASVRHELTVLISAAFHISSNRIYITAAA